MLRATWLAEGYAPVPEDVVPAGLWDELEAEAEKVEPEAVLRHNPRPGLLVLRDGSITSPQRCRVHPGGPALSTLARLPALVDVACQATGAAKMTAIRYGYKWYTPDSHMQVHRDEGKCEITFSAGLMGDLGVMGWLPRLRWLSSREVADRLAHTPYPDGGECLPIRHQALTGFDGVRIPHWRPPYEHPLGVMITICFTSHL
jgi:hypothetical protein